MEPAYLGNTRLLIAISGFIAAAIVLPLVFGEAVWAFALLIAPLMLVAIAAVPLLIWSAARAAAGVLRGEDPRRWVLAFSALVLVCSAALITAALLRLGATR
jgi:hypothetical protein